MTEQRYNLKTPIIPCAAMCIADEQSKHIMSKLVGLLLVHYDACTSDELACALRNLSSMAQLRMDGLHLQRLLSELEAAHAAVQQAVLAHSTTHQVAGGATSSPVAAASVQAGAQAS